MKTVLFSSKTVEYSKNGQFSLGGNVEFTDLLKKVYISDYRWFDVNGNLLDLKFSVCLF